MVGCKATHPIYTLPAAPGTYEQANDAYGMLLWASVALFGASGSAPSYKMWYAEQYPTPIRATGQATVEPIGGRLMGGVIWTMMFPILVSRFGIAVTMAWLAIGAVVACVIVTLFAPETFRRSVEDLEAETAGRASDTEGAGSARTAG